MAKRIVDEEMRFSIIVNGNEAQKELYDLEKSTRNLTKRNKELKAERAKLFREGKRGSAAYKELTKEINQNAAAIQKNKTRMGALQREIGVTGLTMQQLRQRAAKLRVQLDRMVPGSAAYNKLQAELKETTAQMTKLRAASAGASKGLGGLADRFNRYSALGASVIASLTGIVFSLQQVIDYNGKLSDAQSDVMKTTGMTKKEVDDIAKSFGMLQTRTSRINLLKIAEEGGRIGIAKEEIGSFVEVMNKAAVALGDSFPGGVEEVASKLGKLKILFKETKDISVEEAYNAIGSAINDLGADGVATENNIADFATRLGSLPDAIKPSISDALALGAAFEESGVMSEIAGRGYAIALKTAAENSDKFAKVMGKSTSEVEKMIDADPLEFMIQFSKELKGMSATQTARTLKELGLNADGTNKIFGALSNNTDLFRSRLKLSSNAMEEATSLVDEYNIKNNNLAATIEKIGKKIRGYFSSETLVEFLLSATSWFGKFIGATEDADGSVTRFRDRLYILVKILAVITAAIISYNAAVKLTALLTNNAYKATKLYTLAQKVATITQKGLTAATLLGKAAFFAMTGQIKKARAALRLLNITAKMNPFGLLMGAVAALTVAYYAFRQEANLIADLHKKAANNVAKERAELDSLLKVAKNEYASKKDRLDAIRKINQISPEYLDNITLENINTDKTTQAIDRYIAALNKKALSQAAAAKKQELFAKRIEKENEALSAGGANTNSIWSMFGLDSNQFNGIDELNKYLKDSVNNGSLSAEGAQAIRAAYDDVIETRKEDLALIDEQIAALDKYIDVSNVASENTSGGNDNDDESGNDDDPRPTGDGKKKQLYDLEKEQRELREVMRANARAKSELIDEDFLRELEQLEINHEEKLDRLKVQLVKEKELQEMQLKADKARSGGDNETANNLEAVIEIWRKKNKEIKAQMLSEEQVYQLEIGRIIESGQEDQIKQAQKAYEREKMNRETAFNEELSQISNLGQAKLLLKDVLTAKELEKITTLEQAKQALRDDFNQQETEKEKEHLTQLIAEMQDILDTGFFEGFNLDILPEEEKEEMLQRIEELKSALAKLKAAKDKVQGSDSGEDDSGLMGDKGYTDIFGMAPSDWTSMQENIKNGTLSIRDMANAVSILSQTWQAYNQYRSAAENKRFQEFEERNNAEIRKQKRKLDLGLINERQYNKSVEALEQQMDRKRAELEYKQAKRQKEMALFDATTKLALSILNVLSTVPFPASLVAAGLMATMGGLHVATIAKQPLPARGYEDGYYPIQREQDGRIFNARYGGLSSTGMVDQPTYFLAGEKGKTQPEMIISGKDYAAFAPEFRESLHREVARVKGYEQGYYPTQTPQQEFSATDTTALANALNRNSEILEYYKDNKLEAFLVRSPRMAKELQDDIDNYNRIRNKARR